MSFTSDQEFSVFICHSPDDYAEADAITSSIERTGLTCWCAPRNIRSGTDRSDEIARGIRQSKCFVILISDGANLSDDVRRQVELAARAGKAIYPMRVQDVSPSPRLEYFIGMHHWIDAWHGSIDEHARQLVSAIAMESRWVDNRAIRRKRISTGTIATLIAGCVISVAVLFGSDLRFLLKDESGRAQAELAELGIPLNADGFKSVLASADIRTVRLMETAGLSDAEIKQAIFDYPTITSFLTASTANEAPKSAEWLEETVRTLIDPNIPIVTQSDTSRSLILLALDARNVEAALALLRAGGSPYAYETFERRRIRFPMLAFPFRYIKGLTWISESDEKRLVAAMIEAGAGKPEPIFDNELLLEGAREERDAAEHFEKRHNIAIPSIVGRCRSSSERSSYCRKASDIDGYDWCGFENNLYAQIDWLKLDTAPYISEFWRIAPLKLVNVFNGHAVVLAGIDEGQYGLVFIPKNGSRWSPLKYASTSIGKGGCKTSGEKNQEGYCWRGQMLDYNSSENIFTLYGNIKYSISACG